MMMFTGMMMMMMFWDDDDDDDDDDNDDDCSETITSFVPSQRDGQALSSQSPFSVPRSFSLSLPLKPRKNPYPYSSFHPPHSTINQPSRNGSSIELTAIPQCLLSRHIPLVKLLT